MTGINCSPLRVSLPRFGSAADAVAHQMDRSYGAHAPGPSQVLTPKFGHISDKVLLIRNGATDVVIIGA